MKPEIARIMAAVGTQADSPTSKRNYLSSGSTALNLACTGSTLGAFIPGHYYLLVGDSATGKTYFSLATLAEAAAKPQFKDYRLIYDDVEHGVLMNLHRLFGDKMANRIELPGKDDEGSPCASSTVEDLYYNLHDAEERGEPFIYIVDSMDALTSVAEQEKFDEKKKASRKGTKAPGDYGDGKAKTNSRMLRTVVRGLKKTGSILIIVAQTRDNLGFGFAEKIYGGGKALRFYATLEIWLSLKGKEKKTVKGKPRIVGIKTMARVKKNRITGRDRSAEVPIYYSSGIDDVGACIDFLTASGHWKKTSGGINCKELGKAMSREKLIQHIESQNLEPKLRKAVGQVWSEMEADCAVNRKSRYE